MKPHIFFFTIVFIFTLITGTGCESGQEIHDTVDGPYFSLSAYFKKQADELSKKQVRLKKTVVRDGYTEERETETPDWQKEFSIFTDCDLNRKSWIGRYASDSMHAGNDLRISCLSLDSNLRVKRVEILMRSDTLRELTIESRLSNFYYSSGVWMHYSPVEGFSIRSEQAIRFLKSHRFSIRGILVQPL